MLDLDPSAYNLPETCLLNKNAMIQSRYVGAITDEIWQKLTGMIHE